MIDRNVGNPGICKHGQLARQCAVCDEVKQARYDALEEAAAVCDKIALDYSFTPTENTTEDAAMECAAAIRSAVEKVTET